METQRICSICGKPLAANTPEGLCPECLLKAGLGTGADLGTETKTDAPRCAFTPPAIAELAAKFPQLEILEFIGQGGMGAVYKARQKQLDRIVALKILPPQAAAGPGFAERFAREARALAKLNHPHIVTLYEFGQADGLFYFLMEYVDGINLRRLLGASRIAPREALAIVPQICEALQFAHDSGIVHRDIKPENILLDKKGQVKIADFGVAKIVAEGLTEAVGTTLALSGDLTAAGSTLGTPQYMAPEQIKNSAEVDHRADIYSLGVVFYQMLTGELPDGNIQPPSKKVAIDVRLDEVVLRALEKTPELRFQQASQLKTQVETIATTTPVSTDRPAAIANPSAGAGKTERRCSRVAVAGTLCYVPAVLALILVVLLQFVWIRSYQNAAGHSPSGQIHMMDRVRLLQKCELLCEAVTIGSIIAGILLGAFAMVQIRRSAGRIYGMKLALCNAILLPLLAWVFGLSLVFVSRLLEHSVPMANSGLISFMQASGADVGPVSVPAAKAYRGDIGVYLSALGVVESSNEVSFQIAQDYVQPVVKGFDAGQRFEVEASDREGKFFGHGALSGMDNQMDTATGTLKCKANVVPENGQLMIRGMYLNIRMHLGTKHDAMLVPSVAIQWGAQSTYVWGVNPDNKVFRREVKIGITENGATEIQKGLAPNETVVIGHMMEMQDGKTVSIL